MIKAQSRCRREFRSGVSRISFRGGGGGGGVQIISGKVGEATRLLGGFGCMLLRENFKKWCILEDILLKFCQK